MNHTQQSGLLKEIVLIIIALILLKFFFHFDIVAYLKSAQFHQILATLKMWWNQFYTWLDLHIVRPLLGK